MERLPTGDSRHGWSTKVPPTSRGAPFPPPSSRGGILPLRGRDRIPSVPSHLKRRRSPQERREELQGRATIPRAPRCLSRFQGNLFSLHFLDFQQRINSHHGGTWDSPVGKPRKKVSTESHRSLDPREGKRNTAATAREESARACRHSRGGLTPLGNSRSTPRSMSALERNPQVPAPTPHKVLGTGIDGRGIPRVPRATRMGTGIS